MAHIYNLHKVLYLYKTQSKFYIQPVDVADEALIIDLQTCEITVNKNFSVNLLPANTTSSLIYGIIGIKYLFNSAYLIVITKAIQIGAIRGEPIYRMEQADVIPFQKSTDATSRTEQLKWEKTYLSMIESVLSDPNFYFSYSYDLTNSLQRNYNFNQQKTTNGELRMQAYYDKRFLWNDHLMNDFNKQGEITDRYRLPIILGFVSINRISISQGIIWTVVSRRSVKRAGTRFNSRGIDYEGNVSNFVETEQIIEDRNFNISSFVQIRGSIPLFWSQRANYRYKPAIEIATDYDHALPMQKHFDELISLYGNVSVVNLIDKRGHEGRLEHEYDDKLRQLQKRRNIPYHYFDFHKECSKMRWHRLNILLDQLQQEIDNYAYFSMIGDRIVRMQTGVIRSNCIDSLDRTNVVQSMIAQRILDSQLQQFPSLPTGMRLEHQFDFMNTFKNTWADNADALSIQYAGTPALKTDFTRTGQRTQAGLVKDGVNSMVRYVSNNFFDSYRQDAIELFLGLYEGYPSPLYRPTELTAYTTTLPISIVVLTLVGLFLYLRFQF